MIRHMLEVQSMAPYLSQTDVDCHVNMAYDTNMTVHTCDTFLNPNREIWNFWLGNLCLVSGGFHVANFGLFFTEVKVAKSSDIARNKAQSITMLKYANRSEKMRPFTV